MPITKLQYDNLKEYWDYQRKVAYNREQVYAMAEKFEDRVFNDFGMLPLETIKEQIWVRVKPADYEDAPKGWVPKDPSVRFDWEPDPDSPPQLTAPKGRPVVLRAKVKNEDNNI